MKNSITFLFFILILLSCKQKQVEKDISTENSSEITGIKKTVAEKVTDSIVEKEESDKKPNCELKTLAVINSLLEKGKELNDQNFASFFANMNPKCSNNIEYNEFSNELIYKILESNPKKFIAFLSRVSKKKEILEFVLTKLRNPIHDGIELNKIYIQLDKTETEDTQTKKLVSESIKIAIEKYN